jgi:GAF domain-containing protein
VALLDRARIPARRAHRPGGVRRSRVRRGGPPRWRADRFDLVAEPGPDGARDGGRRVGFEPARGRIERSVARLLPDAVRSPYDVLSRFTETVTSGYAGDDVPARIAKVLAEGTGAQWAQVWLVVHGRLSLAATWPPSADADTDPPRAEAPLPATSTLPVRHGGELLAVLRVREHERRPLTTVEQRLFAGLAAQAGLVLRQVRLRAELAERLEELAARAEELQASRERLVEPRTRSGVASSATSTTAPSSTSSPSP